MMLCTIASFTANATTIDHGNNKATVKEKVATMTNEQKEARIEALKARVIEIKAMDRSQLKDRKSTRLNSSHIQKSRMPSSA